MRILHGLPGPVLGSKGGHRLRRTECIPVIGRICR
jgi:hypothetical protein